MKSRSKQFLLPTIAAAIAVTGWSASWAMATTRADEPVKQEKKEEPKKEEPKKDEAWPTVESGAKAELGKVVPDFTLKGLDGKDIKLSSYKGKLIVLEWFSPTCPACSYAYGAGTMKEHHARLTKDGVVWLAVNSEAPDRPGATVEKNKSFFEKNKAEVAVALDPSGAVGKAYGARTTPHMFLINEKGVLVYQGAIDNAPGGEAPKDEPKVNYIDAAIKDIKAGHAVTTPKTTSYG